MDEVIQETLETLPEQADILKVKQEIITAAMDAMVKVARYDAAVRIVGMVGVTSFAAYAIHKIYQDKEPKRA